MLIFFNQKFQQKFFKFKKISTNFNKKIFSQISIYSKFFILQGKENPPMEFIPYKANECFEHLYYQIPMELFFNKNYKNKLNSDSKILYGFLLNRLTLSAKNNWFDKEGNVFLILTRKEVQELLNLSDKTVTKAFKQLSDCKLIYEKKQGSTKPNLIYVGKIEHDKIL